jgi:NADPH:quinone reductase-like Zn-dependent oxidoreductase
MKAIVVNEHGGREVLRLQEVPIPEPAEDQVLIQVHAVSINRTLDVNNREGIYDGPAHKLTPPFILGVDPSGVVVKAGGRVAGLKPGDRVAGGAVGGLGGYAQYALLTQRARIIPDGISFAEATVIGRHFGAAYGEIRRAAVQAGEWVLIMGAAGALGSCAIQVAKHFGANVISGASSSGRIAATLALGADHGVNYREEDLVSRVNEITAGHGADVVLENIGDPTLFPQAFNALARNGRLVTIGAHGGGIVPLDVSRLYLQRLTIMHGMDATEPGDMDEAFRLAAEGQYHALIHSVMPLAQVAEAHRLVEENEAIGKVILDPTLD